MTLAPLREAADSLRKASTPEPFSSSRTSNWVARGGGLPDYIQHIAHDLVEKRGKSESNAIQMAIGIVKRWARGGGNVDAGTRAAAAKAVAEWEKLKGKNAAKGAAKAVTASAVEPTMADEFAVREAALARVAVYSEQFGTAGLVDVLAEGVLAEAAAWNPTLRRTASAAREAERHEVYDGNQHVGTITRRKGFRSEGDRHSAFAVNGTEVTDYNTTSRQDALKALQSHLEEAPARVISLPTTNKFLVATPQSYSGQTTYTSYSSEAAARHAAGLPASPTVPEINSKVDQVAEVLRMDLQTISGMVIPPLRRVQEARRRDPFDLAESFHADEPRGFGGKWIGRGATNALRSRSSDRVAPSLPVAKAVSTSLARSKPRSTLASDARYEGGVVRASAKARAVHAAKPQIAKADDEHPEQALAAAVGSGAWDKSSAAVSKRLVAQPQMGMDEIERKVKSGDALDTETAHRTGPGGAYSKERQALHEHIVSLLLQGKGVHDGKAKAIFTAGGGAAGKSSLIKSGAVKVPSDTVIANPDVVREMLPEYKALKAAGREDAASLTHEESSHITKLVTRLALARQHHLLVDGVGDSGPGKFAGKIKAAKAAGHQVSVHYATVPTAEAISRADARGRKTGRYVDHTVLRSAHKAVSGNFPQVRDIPGIGLEVFDTTKRTPELMANRAHGADKLVIGNRQGFQGFLDKANE